MRYLIKKYGRTIDYVKVPKGATLQRSSKGIRGVQGTKTGVWLKGYKVIEADSLNKAIKKVVK